MNTTMTEDLLVQQTAAEYFRDELGWDYVYAYNEETFGPNGTLGRESDREVYLTRYIRNALKSLNPDLPEVAYDTAIRILTESRYDRNDIRINKEKYDYFNNGVQVEYRNKDGQIEKKRLKVFDYTESTNNHFLIVRELWIQKVPYRRRADIVGFVNGFPLLFIELKNVHKDLRRAFNENLSDYKDTIPHLFDSNAFIILSNGEHAKIGSITSKFGHFNDWKRLSEDEPGVVDFETLLKGVCSKNNFIDLFENFILFDESTGKLIKIIARNHQYLGVNNAIEHVKNREQLNGQLGVFWHTQGSGKSYSMAFFSEKVHRKIKGNFTFLILTDRDDLDSQIYKTFAGCGVVDNDKDECRAASGEHLKSLLKTDKRYVFTMIQKFNQNVEQDDPYSDRKDIIVISDEAHRTQYGRLALNMRNALPHANFIGFTGTPLFKDDEITKRIFGGYVSTYDFKRASDDHATVPLYYDNRGEKLHLTTTEINEKIAEKLEQIDYDPDQQALLEKELSREYHIITAEKRLDAIARDFVWHYTKQWESGKAMFVCIDKITTVRMHNLIQKYWQLRLIELEQQLSDAEDEQQEIILQNQITWLKDTKIAVIVSEEQNEIKKFETWGLDITPHRTLMKKGFELPDGKTLDVELAFKDEKHPFRVAIVCAMWLTGFDVPSLSTLYLDKPIKAHTLMQAIARANRVYEGKNNGLIVDYCGILKNLRKALATFAVGDDKSGGSGTGNDPLKPKEELIEDLAEAISLVRSYLAKRGFDLADLINVKGFELIAAITRAKEAVNQSEETRKRFEINAREVFKLFKACINIPAVNQYVKEHDAIDIIYKKLQDDRDKADISQIIKEMHEIVDDSVIPHPADFNDDNDKIYDISQIDFEKLKEEFKKSPRKNTTVQALKDLIEIKLQKMLDRNPLRTDLNKRYQEIIADYNFEKDRLTIEKTFEALMRFVQNLDDEEKRSMREGLDEEHLALFDLLLKPDISTQAREKIKKVAVDLLDTLKREKLKIDHWRDKDKTRAEVKQYIHDFLWDESKGLPAEAFSIDEVEAKSELVFEHILRQYEDWKNHKYAA